MAGIWREAAVGFNRDMKKKTTPGEAIIQIMNQVIAWANGEDVRIRVTTVQVPVTNVRAIRRRLKLSPYEFALKFGFSPAMLRKWERGRARPGGPARLLLSVIDQHPEVVEEVLADQLKSTILLNP